MLFLEVLSVFMSKIVVVKCQNIGITSFSFDEYIFLLEIAMITGGVA